MQLTTFTYRDMQTGMIIIYTIYTNQGLNIKSN